MSRNVRKFSAAKRLEFIAAARGFMHARWRHQGRRPEAMDCLGLVVLSLAAVGVIVRDRTDYARTPYSRALAASLREHFGPPVPREQLRPADIVTMAWAGEESHVAIVTDHPEGLGLIHCYLDARRVVEHRLSPEYLDRIIEGYRP